MNRNVRKRLRKSEIEDENTPKIDQPPINRMITTTGGRKCLSDFKLIIRQQPDRGRSCLFGNASVNSMLYQITDYLDTLI